MDASDGPVASESPDGPAASETPEEPAAEPDVATPPVKNAQSEPEPEPEPAPSTSKVDHEPADTETAEAVDTEAEADETGEAEADETGEAEADVTGEAEVDGTGEAEVEADEPNADVADDTGAVDTEANADVADDTGAVDTEADDTEAADAADTKAVDTESDEAAETAEPVLVPHRTAGRVLKAAAVLAAVLFVTAAAFAGAAAQRYLLDRAEVQVKFEVAKTAADAITTLFTYTPDDLERLPQRSAQFLSGDFAADYKRYIDSIVAPNKQAQVSNQTQVLGAAVESLSANEATAIVYTNSVSTTPVKKGIPSLQYRSYRLDLKRDDRRWFVTRMTPITTLDLTPRL